MDPLSEMVARRFLAEIVESQETAAEFAAGFFKRHPHLGRFAPRKVLDKAGGGGSHPEARQAGDDVHLFPKFWKLDSKTRDFVFAHELGHLALSKHGLVKLVEALEAVGIDPWDNTSLPFGQANMDEAFADSFASYFLDPGELKHRYPEWDAVLHEIVSR
jgi:hypothetical protein